MCSGLNIAAPRNVTRCHLGSSLLSRCPNVQKLVPTKLIQMLRSCPLISHGGSVQIKAYHHFLPPPPPPPLPLLAVDSVSAVCLRCIFSPVRVTLDVTAGKTSRNQPRL